MATAAQQKAFIDLIAPLMVAEARKRGYKNVSAAIAQACNESAYGLSPSGNHNYFGMKCGGAWKGKSINLRTKEEYQPGVLTSISDNFRVYDTLEDGIKGYYDFIAWSHYAPLKTAENYISYAEILKAKGYATSSTYVGKLCNIVVLHNLEKYDAMLNGKTVKSPILHVGDRGPLVRKMRDRLSKKGYRITTISDKELFDNNTLEALKAYQADNKDVNGKPLEVDGVCGPLTWGSLYS